MFVKKCMEKGVLCLTAKDKVRLLPALNIPLDLLEKAVDIIKKKFGGDFINQMNEYGYSMLVQK